MGTYNIHAGHAPYGTGGAYGAVGLLNESNEARAVKDRLIELLKTAGNTVYDCTCDKAYTKDKVLSYIVNLCNKHSVDLDISIHLNSGRNDSAGDGSTGGVEVYGYNTDVKDIAETICNEISLALEISNRGFKINTSLYVLKNTRAKSILIECCFVDDKDDADKWNPDKCAEAIYEALGYSTNKCTNKYGVGQYVVFSSSYPTPTSYFGSKYATSGAGKGKITAIKDGQACYEINNGTNYCNDGDIRSIISKTATTATSSVSVTAKTLNVNAYYKVYAGGRWYSEVKNLEDFAGDGKNAIRGIAIRVDNGLIRYRVHLRNSGWLPYVTGYDINDIKNGYAGNGRDEIDAVEVYYSTPAGFSYKKAKYRVSPVNGTSYYDWQYDNETTNGQDGYAGQFGKSFGRFQIIIE